MRKNLMIVVAMLAVVTGCQSNPAPPSVNDAKVTWNNINKRSGLGGDIELVDLKKTDGQMAEVNGTKVYTFFYEAREKHLTKMGDWKPGDIETVKSNYGFQKTENGWQGPDGTHFPN
ncbi:MAG: hypothetical protein WCE63_24055 [Acidobacteriaceae bacterium]